MDLGHPQQHQQQQQQQQQVLPAAGDENDMDDFQQQKPYRYVASITDNFFLTTLVNNSFSFVQNCRLQHCKTIYLLSRQPPATPSRSPLANLLSQPPSTAFPYPSPAKTPDDLEG